MYKISELIGKQSITLVDADSRGVVAGAYFDRMMTKCRYFLLLSDEDENRYFVDYKNLSSLKEDAMVINSSGCITQKPSGDIVPSPINLPAFNQDGKSLGIIRDIVMEDSAVAAFVTDSGQIEAGTLLSRSDSIVVFNDTGKPLKIKRSFKKSSFGGAVGAASDFENGSYSTDGDTEAGYPADAGSFGLLGGLGNSGGGSLGEFGRGSRGFGNNSGKGLNRSRSKSKNAVQKPSDNTSKVETPFKVSPFDNILSPNVALSKYYFLLGKRLQRSIYSEKGTLIARENDLITEDIIKSAKDGGRLVAIALHSL